MFTTAKEAMSSKTFIGQLIITMIINFGINFGFGWATYSSWGKHGDRSGWPTIGVWTMNPETNSCLALDVPLTTFLIGSLCMLLGSNGAQKDVREKKCDILDSSVTARGWWRYTPVGIRSLALRSLANGLYFTAVFGVPTLLILWMAVQGGTMPGFAWVLTKGFWAMMVASGVYVIVFMSAVDARNFPEIEFQALHGTKSEIDGTPIPLVGQVSPV